MKHGTTQRPGITCKKIFHKSLLNSACLWSRARLAINKKTNRFSLLDKQLKENLFFFLVFRKGKQRDQSKLGLNLYEFNWNYN